MENDFEYRLLNRSQLRTLFGRRSIGAHNRKDIKISITPSTLNELTQIVEFGNGKYGSTIIELAIKLFVNLIDVGDNLKPTAEIISKVVNSPYLISNLDRLRQLLAEAEKQEN